MESAVVPTSVNMMDVMAYLGIEATNSVLQGHNIYYFYAVALECSLPPYKSVPLRFLTKDLVVLPNSKDELQ